ncbi:hypothetical protein ACOMHN_033479 [Nucella lapillus]
MRTILVKYSSSINAAEAIAMVSSLASQTSTTQLYCTWKGEGSSYYKWDLGGSLLDIPTTSLDSAAFRSTANPVFNRNPVFSRHPAYHPLGSTD